MSLVNLRVGRPCVRWLGLLGLLAHSTACGGSDDAGTSSASTTSGSGVTGPSISVVVFTHIEDNSPAGALGSPQSVNSYEGLRASLLELAGLARARGVVWVLQPDWKILEAALIYEDDARMATTGGKNAFAYLHEDLGVPIDPHSHENGGYNYADVAYLLDRLGVGGSSVIGGHIWDPSLPQFQEWDRFREPLTGLKYPKFTWSGDILIGAGTPNHVNDPLTSGVWRPKDRDHFFDDEPAGDIVAIGPWRDEVAGVEELAELVANGAVPRSSMLTASWNVPPATLLAEGGPAAVDAEVFVPLAAMRDAGKIELTDFSALTERWREEFGATASLYMP